MAAEGIPYVAEVSARTVNDRKGGQLVVRRSDGRLVLRDSAMVEPGEEHHFQDLERHRWFHTNNLWVDLDVLAARLDERDGVLGLPIIVNRKTVDPTDPESTPVVQIESAMGAAVELFDGARAVAVDRSRFRPVKTTNELLLLRSDLYRISAEGVVEATTDRPEPFVDLGPEYRLLDGFEARFPHGAPSLRECTSLRVEADVTFGADVVCVGDVHLTGGARDRPGRHPARGRVLMRSVAEHRAAVLALVAPLGAERVPVGSALGRVLAEDVTAVVDLPGFENSAMDGYAVRAADLVGAGDDTPVVLPVDGDIAAGDTTRHVLAPGRTMRIMTGAPVPEGCDAVVPVERTDGGATRVSVHLAPEVGRHLRHRGEDVRAGSVVLRGRHADGARARRARRGLERRGGGRAPSAAGHGRLHR